MAKINKSKPVVETVKDLRERIERLELIIEFAKNLIQEHKKSKYSYINRLKNKPCQDLVDKLEIVLD